MYITTILYFNIIIVKCTLYTFTLYILQYIYYNILYIYFFSKYTNLYLLIFKVEMYYAKYVANQIYNNAKLFNVMNR